MFAWTTQGGFHKVKPTAGRIRFHSGNIEADESFIGGKARNMHTRKRAQKIHGRGPDGKTIIAAVLERHGEVRVTVLDDRRKKAVQSHVREHVEAGSNLLY
jgi:hypothetical protein